MRKPRKDRIPTSAGAASTASDAVSAQTRAESDAADLLLLFSNSPNPVIYLDDKLKIRQFTPSALEVYHLLPSDQGRPLEQIHSRLSGGDLLGRCAEVCRTMEPQEILLTLVEGDSPPRTFQTRIHPSMGPDQRLGGILLNFIDITELQQAKVQTERRQRQLAAVAEMSNLVSQEGDIDRLYRQALAMLTRVLAVDAACLLRCPRNPQAWEFLCVSGAQPAEYNRIRRLPAIAQTLSADRTISFFGSPQSKSGGKPRGRKSGEICSGITTRIPDNKEVPWVLCAFQRQLRDFTFDEIDFLESIAFLLGTAMARSQEHFLNALDHVIAGALGHPLGFLGAKREMLMALAKELEASVCDLWLPDPSRGGALSRYAGASGTPADSFYHSGEARSVAAEGMTAQAWETRIPVWVAVGSFPAEHRPTDRPELSGFAIPLMSGQERLGVLCCSFPRRHFYSRRLMLSLAHVGLSLGEFLRRSRAEAELVESEKSLFQALKALPFPLGIIEEDLGLRLVSDITYRLTGFGPDEISKVDEWTAKVSRGPAAQQAVMRAVEEALSSCQVRHHGTTEIWTATGQRALWDFTTVPLPSSASGKRRMMAVAYDVTELEANRKRLEDSARHKDGFLAMLGHELRNPLAAIRNGVQLIAMGDSEADHQEAMGIIDRQSSQMALLIDGLLDLNRISLGKVSLEPVPLNLTRLAKTLIDDKRKLFEAKGLELLFEPGPTVAWTRGDPVRLVQVLDNLLGNSLKFMEAPGAVSVSLAVDANSVRLSVKDTGQGMTPDLAAVVFEPFRQGEQTLARPHGGLGLGLSLVKQIVELHGGTVKLYSEGPGKGCEFSISLAPCCAGDETPPIDTVETATVPWSILYVEDDLDLAVSLGRILEAAGHEVRHALDANVALDLVAARTPEVILCDLGLAGEMDGFGLLQQFQKIESLKDVPVVAVTGYGLAADKARVQATGFAAHLTKPFEAADLQRLLRELLRPQPVKLPRPDFCRTLVVDDHRMIAEGTARMLSKLGFEARFALSGAEALRIAKEQSPHLALLDLGLPDCDGQQLKEQLSGLSQCQECLYLAITGSDEPADIERTARAGFAAHLVKPVSLERLLQEFERVASNRALTTWAG